MIRFAFSVGTLALLAALGLMLYRYADHLMPKASPEIPHKATPDLGDPPNADHITPRLKSRPPAIRPAPADVVPLPERREIQEPTPPTDPVPAPPIRPHEITHETMNPPSSERTPKVREERVALRPTVQESKQAAKVKPPNDSRKAAPLPQRKRTHQVRRGDSLWAISRKYYDTGAHVQYLAQVNGLSIAHQIRPGQVLVIPTITSQIKSVTKKKIATPVDADHEAPKVSNRQVRWRKPKNLVPMPPTLSAPVRERP